MMHSVQANSHMTPSLPSTKAIVLLSGCSCLRITSAAAPTVAAARQMNSGDMMTLEVWVCIERLWCSCERVTGEGNRSGYLKATQRGTMRRQGLEGRIGEALITRAHEGTFFSLTTLLQSLDSLYNRQQHTHGTCATDAQTRCTETLFSACSSCCQLMTASRLW